MTAKKTKTTFELNENQSKTVLHKTGPLLVVAGAGTGKTRVITERIKNLVTNENVNSKEILALTFTEKAAAEMLNRLSDVMPLGYEEPWVCTFHSFADRLLRSEGIEIGLDPGYKILSGPDQWILLRRNIFKLNLQYFRPLGNPTKFIGAFLKFMSRLQDENIMPTDFTKFVETSTFESEEETKRFKELAYIYERYSELKMANSRMDFGDLITWTIELFKQRPNILKKYQDQFKHVLLDEFQDTNYAQYELIKMMCPQEMGERSLIAVGDDSQSIYKFRGAAVSNILQFMEDYPKAEMITLLENYRSTQKILDPSYKLIQNNNPDTLESRLGISKKLISKADQTGDAPHIIHTETLEDEVEFVVKEIQDILAKEPQYTYKDIAILARANSHLDPFMLALRKYGLPYQLVGNRGLYDQDEIRDIIALLKVVLNPKDNISLYRTLNISTLNIPFEEISNLLTSSRYKKQDLWETINESQNAEVISLKEKIRKYQAEITKTSPTQLVFNLVTSIEYVSQFTQEESIENSMAIKNLDIFLGIIKRFEVDYHEENKNLPTLIDFVDYLDLIIDAGDNPAQAEIEDIDTVNLMTVHASKGLEFPVVFLVNLVADRFPTRNKSDVIEIPNELIKETLPTGDEHIQEERRLFYVGMTRACKYLYLTHGKNYGGKRDKTPSGYLQETGIKPEEISAEDIKNRQTQTGLFGVDSGFRNPDTTPIIKSFKPDSLSFTQMDTFLTCPLKYKFSYVLRIPTAPNHALSFGITIHESLREFHLKKMFDEDLSLEQLMQVYEEKWQPLGYMDENHRNLYFENGKKLLTAYYEKNNPLHVKHIGLEKPFTLRLNGIKFYGKIDRIDAAPDGGVEIIDYKTGQTKTQKDVDKDAQVSIYAIAAKEAFGLNPTLLSYYFVESGEKLSTTRTPLQLEEQRDQIFNVMEELKKANFTATPGMHCSWCDYRDLCPFAYKG